MIDKFFENFARAPITSVVGCFIAMIIFAGENPVADMVRSVVGFLLWH